MARSINSGRVALVLSGLALLLALSGTAYAVNTVRSADIVDGTIKTQDIGNGQVTGSRIKQGTISTADVDAGSLGRSPRLFAHVRPNATVVSAGVTEYQLQGAVHLITFDRSIVECAITVTARAPDFTNFYANYSYNGTPDRQIGVQTFNPDGSAVLSAVDVIVVC